MKKNKILFLLVAITIATLAIAIAIGKKRKSNQAIEVEMQKIQKQTIVQTVAASGKIYPVEEVKISSDVSGEIVELYVKEGEIVEKGQILARIQSESYAAYVEQAQANLDNAKANESTLQSRLKQAEAQLLNAKNAYDRTKNLYEKKIISKSELEQAETAYKSAQAEWNAGNDGIKAAQYTTKAVAASIKDAKNNLNRTTIYAPMSGIVSLLNVKKGEKVVGTLQMSGTEIMRISNFEQMEVRIDVSESEIIKIKKGDSASIEIDAYLDRKFTGFVSEVSNTSKGASGLSYSLDQSTNFVVKVIIDRNSYQDLLEENAKPFLPGMSATVEIKTKTKTNVLAVPIQAVIAKDTLIDGNMKTSEIVFINSAGIATAKIVKTGIQNDSYIEIVDGLKGDEMVVIGPYNTINKKLQSGNKIIQQKPTSKKTETKDDED